MSNVIGSGVPVSLAPRVAIVGYESAKEFWRDDSNLGLLDDCFDPDGKLVFVDEVDLSQAATRAQELADLSITLFEERPLDLLAPYRSRTDCPLVNLHQMRWEPPNHSFVAGRDGVLVVSPELLFLESAASYSLVELLKLGMELCGTYSIDPYSADGCSSRRKVCTVNRIKRYLAKCKGAPGLRLARSAASLLMDGSNSPLETNAMLGLTLPPKYRGLGLRKPVLNDCRKTTKLQAETIGEHTYYYDARWSGTLRSGKRYSVDCEVDSTAHHFSDPKDAKADVTRTNNVQFMRSDHLSITSDDLNDPDRFVMKGLMIASLIGQRVRRYPRRGTEEERTAYDATWAKRVREIGELLRELASDAHAPRPRPQELKAERGALARA